MNTNANQTTVTAPAHVYGTDPKAMHTPEGQKAMADQQHAQAAAAKGIVLASEKDPVTGTVISHATGQRVNPEVQQRITKIIQNTVKSAQGLTGQVFRMIRECKDYGVAVGTFAAAEAVVTREAKVKSINQLSKLNYNSLASYMAIKSTLFSAVRDHEDLAVSVQALWNWNNEKEGAEKKIIPEGFMDAFSDRYKDPQKGSTQFLSDYRMAKPAADDLKFKQQQYERAQKKALEEHATKQGQTPATNGPNAGIATSAPGGAMSDMDKDTLTAVKELTTLIHEVYRNKAITPVELRQWLFARIADLRTWDTERRTKAGALANEATQEAQEKAKEEPVVEGENQGTASDGTAVKAMPDGDALPDVPSEEDVLGGDLTDEDRALIEQHAPDDGNTPAPQEGVA